jgi:TPR repeat protein
MAARVATWLAIAVGGTGGALAAWAGAGPAPSASPSSSSGLPLRPLSAIAAQATSAEPMIAPATPRSSSAILAAPPSEVVTAALPAPQASDAAVLVAPPPAADLLPLPTTKETLLRLEMQCDQRKSEACIVAARSYESGSAGLTDPEKAAKYRRIALTAWISQCDHNSALACATLGTMYRVGSGVPLSERNAAALFARARELCRFNDTPICHELPNP